MDEKRIQLNDTSVESWAKILNCNSNDLWQAVLTVGPSVNSVKAYLEMNGKIRTDIRQI